MTHKEKKALIEDLVRKHEELDLLFRDLSKITGDVVESRLFNTVWAMFDSNIKLTASLIGDEFEWLNWYIYDNACGRGGLAAVVKGKEIRVNNADRLLGVMEADDVENEKAEKV